MKLTLTTCIGLVITLVTMGCTNISRADAKLYETVKSDFKIRYPDFEFIECGVGEGDLAVAYVHIKYRKQTDKKIYEEVWQYWSVDDGWKHRDKVFEEQAK